MSDEMQFEALEPPPAVTFADPADLMRLHAVPVELAVEIGRTSMTIGEALALGPGSIVSLNRMAGEPVDLLVNGRQIARGEVVVIDEEFGLRITEVVSVAKRLERAGGPNEGPEAAPAPAPVAAADVDPAAVEAPEQP
jgi:flagellar motor switch protein FliN/FliY